MEGQARDAVRMPVVQTLLGLAAQLAACVEQVPEANELKLKQLYPNQMMTWPTQSPVAMLPSVGWHAMQVRLRAHSYVTSRWSAKR